MFDLIEDIFMKFMDIYVFFMMILLDICMLILMLGLSALWLSFLYMPYGWILVAILSPMALVFWVSIPMMCFGMTIYCFEEAFLS